VNFTIPIFLVDSHRIEATLQGLTAGLESNCQEIETVNSLLALGAVSPRNKDQDTCFKASDPCFHEKYVKNAHR
jgi:hypothetical protein